MRPVEYLLLGYLCVVTIVAVVRAPERPACWWLLPAHALAASLVYLVRRPGLGPVGRTLREVFPIIVLLALYSEIDILNGSGAATIHDATIQRWELALLGSQPSRDWWQRAPSRFWSTLLHGAYLSYYFILSVPAIWLLARRKFPAVRGFVLSVMIAFLSCYLVFLFYPVAGPYYAFPHPTGAFVDNPMARLVYAALARGSSFGAAFPSSHVAAAVAATLGGWRGSRTLGLTLAIPTALLTIAVVYCQMHYAVDAIAGLLAGVAAAMAGARVERD
ncbi:MAG: phosphatase PAP2 family protein [Gemmatimonadales bacterium]|nr:phosphatase PAP2 family protein [Gemmatimonadales bacterium]